MAIFGTNRGGQPLFVTPPQRQRLPFTFGDVPWQLLAYSKASGSGQQREAIDTEIKALPGHAKPWLQEQYIIDQSLKATEQELFKKAESGESLTTNDMLKVQNLAARSLSNAAMKPTLEQNFERANAMEANLVTAKTGDQPYVNIDNTTGVILPEMVTDEKSIKYKGAVGIPETRMRTNYEKLQKYKEDVDYKYNPYTGSHEIKPFNFQDNFTTLGAWDKYITGKFNDASASMIINEGGLSSNEIQSKSVGQTVEYVSSQKTGQNTAAVKSVKNVVFDHAPEDAKKDIGQQFWKDMNLNFNTKAGDIDVSAFNLSDENIKSGKTKIESLDDVDQDQYKAVLKQLAGGELNDKEKLAVLQVEKNYAFNKTAKLEPIYLKTSQTVDRQIVKRPGEGDGTGDDKIPMSVWDIFTKPGLRRGGFESEVPVTYVDATGLHNEKSPSYQWNIMEPGFVGDFNATRSYIDPTTGKRRVTGLFDIKEPFKNQFIENSSGSIINIPDGNEAYIYQKTSSLVDAPKYKYDKNGKLIEQLEIGKDGKPTSIVYETYDFIVSDDKNDQIFLTENIQKDFEPQLFNTTEWESIDGEEEVRKYTNDPEILKSQGKSIYFPSPYDEKAWRNKNTGLLMSDDEFKTLIQERVSKPKVYYNDYTKHPVETVKKALSKYKPEELKNRGIKYVDGDNASEEWGGQWGGGNYYIIPGRVQADLTRRWWSKDYPLNTNVGKAGNQTLQTDAELKYYENLYKIKQANNIDTE